MSVSESMRVSEECDDSIGGVCLRVPEFMRLLEEYNGECQRNAIRVQERYNVSLGRRIQQECRREMIRFSLEYNGECWRYTTRVSEILGCCQRITMRVVSECLRMLEEYDESIKGL